MHLDPDFGQLTYGDNGLRRGQPLAYLGRGDVVVFYAGLRPVAACQHRLVYALVGPYRVSEVVRLESVVAPRWSENAHTRCLKHEGSDVIVRAEPGSSGRLRRCIPIGEFRDRAYRVTRGILESWGGGSPAATATFSEVPSCPGSSIHSDSSVGSSGRAVSWSARTTLAESVLAALLREPGHYSTILSMRCSSEMRRRCLNWRPPQFWTA